MKNLKIILLFSILFILTLISFYKNINYKSLYKDQTEIIGEIEDLKKTDDKVILVLKNSEKIVVNYYNDFNYKLGDTIKVIGTLNKPSNNTNFNLFNYKKYLLSKRIYYTFNAKKIEKISNNKNIIYSIKTKLRNHINKYKTKEYLNTLILGENTIESNIKDTYKNNGISHLFAISGMHVTLLTTILLFILNKLKKTNINYLIIIIILFLYGSITNFTPSILRAILLFSFIKINKILKLNLKTIYILIIITLLLLIYNPFYIYDLGFKFSFIISYFLIYFNKIINNYRNYFIKIFIISLISFLASTPILINNFFSINLLSPFINIIFVPFISIIIFPLSLLTLIIKPLDNILFLFIKIMENISLFFNRISFFTIILPKINILIIILYYLLIIFIIYKIKYKKYYYLCLFLIVIFFHSNINYLNNYNMITMLDVGQGDSILLNLSHNKGNILIDTGGKILNKNSNISKNITIPYLKSIGIKKLHNIIITHGDYDHMGEAINLVNNFKVEKVIFNCGPYNDLEKELIKVLDKKNIPYYSCIKELNIDKNKLYFLQTKEYDNENDNSNVIYTELNGYKFMFMGDASSTTEKEILDKYNLPDIDILKVGHHGSRTSSSIEFINEINPKFSIISVGKKNRYGHPNKKVLENLEKSRIYRTDQDGSIMFKIKNNKLKIVTCTP